MAEPAVTDVRTVPSPVASCQCVTEITGVLGLLGTTAPPALMRTSGEQMVSRIRRRRIAPVHALTELDPTYRYPDTAPAGEHNTPEPPRYPRAGSKAAAALNTT